MRRLSVGWMGLGVFIMSACATHRPFHHRLDGEAGEGGDQGQTGGTTSGGAGSGGARSGASGHGDGGTDGGTTAGGASASGSTAMPAGGASSLAAGGSNGQGGSGHGGAAMGISGKETAAAGEANGGAPDQGGAGDGTCPGTTQACGNGCIDFSTSKSNCGGCGRACEDYQFCSSGKCLPHYVSTRVQPETSGGTGAGALAVGVFTDGAEDDLLLQVGGDLVLSDPNAAITAELHGSGLARYTPDGTLIWSRDYMILLGNSASYESMPILLSNGDIGMGYLKYDPSGGPVAGTYNTRVSRIGGHSGNLVWEATFSDKLSSPRATLGALVELAATQEIVSFSYAQTFEAGGTVCTTTDLGSSRAVTCPATQSYIMNAAAGADGTTLWILGSYDNGGAVQLNPWSSQTWQLTANPNQASGGDGYLLGAKADGTTTGPWFTEGDYGVLTDLIVDAAGDLLVCFSSSGFVAFNGGQELLPNGGQVLAKIDHTNGHIVWKTTIPYQPDQFVLAPGGRVVTVTHPTSDSPNTLGIYDGSTGKLLSDFPINGSVVTGRTELYVAGSVDVPADFDPGVGTDVVGATPGIFVSRFTFQ